MQSFSKPGQREMVAEYINDDYRVRHRVARFFQTIKGFHTVRVGYMDCFISS